MKFIQVVIALTAILNTSSALRSHKNDPRELKAEDLGKYHNQAFDKLGELLANVSADVDDHKVFQHAVSAVASSCNKGDIECVFRAHETTMEVLHNGEDSGVHRRKLLESFDGNLKKSIENVYENISLLNTNNSESVLETLNGILIDAMNMETSKEVDKVVAIGVVSVAIASTELWTSLRSTSDPRRLALLRHCDARRCLDDSSSIVQDDIDGAIEGAVDFLAEQISSFSLLGIFQVVELLQKMLQESIARSIRGLLGI